MSRLSAVSETVQHAREQLSLDAAKLIFSRVQLPLTSLISAWNTLYPQGDKAAAVSTFKAAVEPISGAIDAWNLLKECITQENIDCQLDDQSVLDIFLRDGQTFPRPLQLTNVIQYYYVLLQKSAALSPCG